MLAKSRPAVQADGGDHRLDMIHFRQAAEPLAGQGHGRAAARSERLLSLDHGLADALAPSVAQLACHLHLFGSNVGLASFPTRPNIDAPELRAAPRLAL